MSNTAFLRDLGWSGIQIDADPYWKKYWLEQKLILINCIVSADGKGVKFKANKKAHRLSTISEEGDRKPSYTLDNIMTSSLISHNHVPPINLMSLDVEGIEYEVFKSLNKKYWPDILVVEYDTLGKRDFRLQNFLSERSYYKQLHRTENNFIFYHTDRTYNYHRSCWRYKHGNVRKSEDHPCYFCGELLPMKYVDRRECVVCGIMKCPACHNCLCTITDLQYSTLIRIHKKYCCHLDKYNGIIELDKPCDPTLANNYLKVLQTCSSAERENGNI
jgi:hypothetical protein